MRAKEETLDALLARQCKENDVFAFRARTTICKELPQMIRDYSFEFGGDINPNELRIIGMMPVYKNSITPKEKMHEENGTVVQFCLVRKLFSETEGEPQYCLIIVYSEFPNLPQPQTKIEVACFRHEGGITQTDFPFVRMMLRP